MTPTPDTSIPGLNEAYERIDYLAALAKTDCDVYARHVWEGGDPTAIGDYNTGFDAAKPHAAGIVTAIRVARGQPPNVCQPREGHGFRLFDYLYARRGLPVSAAQIVSDVPRSRYGPAATYQVENVIPARYLRDAGWALQKSRLDGKVAYELVAIESDDADA